MTKKETEVFRKIYEMSGARHEKLSGIFKQNNFYYSANLHMFVRTFDKPDLPLIPEENQDSSFYKKIEETLEIAILKSTGMVNLPTKSELVAIRKNLTAYEKWDSPYLLTTSNGTKIGVNNRYLNLFLDLFGGKDCYCYASNPLAPLYFVDEQKNIEGVLLPMRINNPDKIINQ